MKMESDIQLKNPVLDQETIRRKLRRMALQVAEQNADAGELIIAGIQGNGDIVAEALVGELRSVIDLALTRISIQLDKKDPMEIIIRPETAVDGKTIVLVDDVANSGKTMFYALKPFLNARPKKIQTLVLVERSHKLFPIQTDYVGLSITTTLQEHIFVETRGSEILGAFLF
jgi:pyrimidine operon attenuation protein/uracil phosphoribosyltransferase